VSLRAVRLAAVLMPAALLLHEAAYGLTGGSLIGAHHYLELMVPIAVALAASLAFAALVLPALGAPGGGPSRHAPLVLAAALIGIFVAQELVEALILGGGMEGLAASASVAWLAPPLALLLGALASGLITSLERTGALLASPLRWRRPRRRHGLAAWVLPPAPWVPAAACAGLSFGFARRPPPRGR
jgi:hypothetical protein